MKNLVAIFAVIGVLFSSAIACFDTYLFLHRGSMVYPKGGFIIDGSGEYTINEMANPGEDAFAGTMNLYYGFSERFSLQAGLASSEKDRTNFAFDEFGVRGVTNIVRNYKDYYNLDAILECVSSTNLKEVSFEFSTPNIFYVGNFVFVAHPVVAFGKNIKASLRGHGGIFYNIGDVAIVGIGSEYESNQSGSQFIKKLTAGEGATSLFLGARLGKYFYFQNEIIKGWGPDAKDIGFALTLKAVLPTRKR